MNQPEHDLQVALIKWWTLQHKNYRLPEFALFAIPNGAKRNIVTAVKLKAEGVKRGVPDLLLAVPNKHHHGLFIEMKANKNGLSKEQREFFGHALTQGYQSAVCWDWLVAAQTIDEYLKDR